MKKQKAAGKTVTLKVRYDDFETITRSHTLPNYTRDPAVLEEVARKLLSDTEAGQRKVRLLGISVSTLNTQQRGAEGEQLELPFSR